MKNIHPMELFSAMQSKKPKKISLKYNPDFTVSIYFNEDLFWTGDTLESGNNNSLTIVQNKEAFDQLKIFFELCDTMYEPTAKNSADLVVFTRI